MDEVSVEQFYKKVGLHDPILFYARAFSENLYHFDKYDNGFDSNDINNPYVKEMLMRRTGKSTFAIISAIVDVFNGRLAVDIVEEHSSAMHLRAYTKLVGNYLDKFFDGNDLRFTISGYDYGKNAFRVNLDVDNFSRASIVIYTKDNRPVLNGYDASKMFNDLSVMDYFEHLTSEAQEYVLLNMEKF